MLGLKLIHVRKRGPRRSLFCFHLTLYSGHSFVMLIHSVQSTCKGNWDWWKGSYLSKTPIRTRLVGKTHSFFYSAASAVDAIAQNTKLEHKFGLDNMVHRIPWPYGQSVRRLNMTYLGKLSSVVHTKNNDKIYAQIHAHGWMNGWMDGWMGRQQHGWLRRFTVWYFTNKTLQYISKIFENTQPTMAVDAMFTTAYLSRSIGKVACCLATVLEDVTTELVSLFISYKLIETFWRIQASMDVVLIGSGNGLSPVRRQTITWTNDNV